MDFVSRFAEHQVERIRRALIVYRSKYGVGDVTLTNEILKYLSYDVTYDATLKNVQRLRKGEPIRGTTFLNACVKFLEVNMTTPQEEELGLAMQRFVGTISDYERLIENLEGDYAVLVLGKNKPVSYEFTPTAVSAPRVVVGSVARRRPRLAAAVTGVLSLGKGEGKNYGVAREKYHLPVNTEDEESPASAINFLQPTGVCLPVTGQDFLVMMRDFLFSHMYVLRRDETGFSGTLILPSLYELFHTETPLGGFRSHYDVKLERVFQR